VSDAPAPHIETLARISRLVGQLGLDSDRILDPGRLSYETGIPADTVRRLLAGEDVPQPDLGARVRERIQLLRGTRLRPDGSPFSLEEIAAAASTTRQWLSEQLKAGSFKNHEITDGIRRFFKVKAGFLTADDSEALDEALQPVLRALEERAAAGRSTLTDLHARHGLRRIALRAPELDEGEQELVADWIDTILQRRARGTHTGTESSTTSPTESNLFGI